LAERGGPTTQEGIYYQNTVAARYLVDLRVAMGNASKAALRTACKDAQEQIATITGGRPFRVP
jgi:hypothetical protein